MTSHLNALVARELNETRRPGRGLEAVVSAARAGDDAAWTHLVERFDRMLRRIAGSYRLAPCDVDDVLQATWLRLFKHIDRLREPAALPGWLATTTRRESLRVLQVAVQERLTDDPCLGDGDGAAHGGPETELLAGERRDVLDRAIATLPARPRELMRLLATDPAPDYEQISATLSMPIGSIGPVRARSLARLERHPELRRLRDGVS